MSDELSVIKMSKIVSIALSISVSLISFNVFSADKPVATVNGKPIDKKTFDAYIIHKKTQDPKYDTEKNREKLIQELVNRELMFQDALNKKLNKDKDVLFQLEQHRIDLLIKHAIRKTMLATPITDTELKLEYDRRVKAANVMEFKARHILVKKEDKAKSVIEELNNGKEFIKLAKAYSTGPTGKNGGDLGWFNARQMVPEFSKTVASMKKGSYTKAPVKTKFGWHVIKLEDTRKMDPPKFSDIKKQVRAIMQNKKLQEYILKLRKEAKIKINKQRNYIDKKAIVFNPVIQELRQWLSFYKKKLRLLSRNRFDYPKRF